MRNRASDAMAFAMIADLPLGVYHGHLGDGDVDPVPSPARLHAALLCAAASGPRAVLSDDVLRPNESDLAALQWLEYNPPDGIQLPMTVINYSTCTAYRDDGLLWGRKKLGLKVKKPGKPAGQSVAVSGPLAWIWNSDPPAAVRSALAELCADVSHLGMSESPVRLRVGTAEASHLADPEADLFGGIGLDVTQPRSGRTKALLTGYQNGRAVAARDARGGYGTDEKSLPPPLVTAGLATGRYRPRERPAVGPTPWTQAVLVPLDKPIPPDYRVRWAVAVHRALIAQVGDGAPALLTGEYADGVAKPANRVAIHFLEEGWPFAAATGSPATLAVLIPECAGSADLEAIGAATGRLRIIRGPGGRTVRAGTPAVMAAHEFWLPPSTGLRRWWLTEPVAVPEIRPPRRGSWSLADTVTTAVGLVWRDVLGVHGRGDDRYRALAAAATGRGVRVAEVSRVKDGDLGRFVHVVRPGTLIQPYRALLSLGDLAGDRVPVAIGQSRHLGGGLLVPADLSNEPGGGEQA